MRRRSSFMILARLLLAFAALVVSSGAEAQGEPDFATLARSAGQPQIPGLRIVYLVSLGNPAQAPWTNIILHQTEGAPGAAKSLAEGQAKNPTKRGVHLWVETDGTIYWAVPETVIATHGDGANRNDNKYIDNAHTYRQVIRTNSIGVEFNGNAPDVRVPPTAEQFAAALILVRFLQERYGIPAERIYAHNWIDYKDSRYCEGCELATRARAQDYRPAQPKEASGVKPPAGR
jgi:N-acetyl-anhydromuramyl-L-alanine amidase AmpD